MLRSMTRTFVLRLLSKGRGTTSDIAGRVEIVHSGEHCAVSSLEELEAVLLRELADGQDPQDTTSTGQP